MCEKKARPAIFSRDHHTCYQWLIQSLESSSVATSVQCHYITNNFQDFQDKVRDCTFAILYHSKTHGRLNVTDVTDSLYENELKHLHETLGKNNVIVVLDDLEDSSDQVKLQILGEQPSIGRLAHALLLFGGEDRRTWTSGSTEAIPLITSNMKERNLGQIVKILRAHNRSLWYKEYFRPALIVTIVLLALVVIGLVVFEEVRR